MLFDSLNTGLRSIETRDLNDSHTCVQNMRCACREISTSNAPTAALASTYDGSFQALLPQDLHVEVKPLQSPVPALECRRPQGFPVPATKPKSDHQVQKCARDHNGSAVEKSAHQFLRACAVEMHFEDLEVNECTVNRSELAVAKSCEDHLKSTTASLIITPFQQNMLGPPPWPSFVGLVMFGTRITGD